MSKGSELYSKYLEYFVNNINSINALESTIWNSTDAIIGRITHFRYYSLPEAPQESEA